MKYGSGTNRSFFPSHNYVCSRKKRVRCSPLIPLCKAERAAQSFVQLESNLISEPWFIRFEGSWRQRNRKRLSPGGEQFLRRCQYPFRCAIFCTLHESSRVRPAKPHSIQSCVLRTPEYDFWLAFNRA